MGTKIEKRLSKLREAMRREGVSAYYINTADFHDSEYVNDYFKVREYFSGFTGSNGDLVVMQGEAGLWTDGRYFVQAEQELQGSGITLYRMGEEGVPTVREFLAEKLGRGSVLGFDGRTVKASFGKELKKLAKKNGFRLSYKKDLSKKIFERPEFPVSTAEVLPPELTGETTLKKLERVRHELKTQGAAALFMSKLDDIMWLFNIRGNDVECNPVLMSYAYITEKSAMLFVQKKAATEKLRSEMDKAGVIIADYDYVKKFLKKGSLGSNVAYLPENGEVVTGSHLPIDDLYPVMVDLSEVNYTFYKILKKRVKLLPAHNPVAAMKAVKNATELAHMRKIYLKDSVALTKFIHTLVTRIGEGKFTEMNAADLLLEYRREIPEFRDLSFGTISAYGANAAMMHYEPSEENPVELKAEHMLLVDSGGQYNGGTTDVTRTIVLGPITDEEKHAFTLTACSMLNLLNAKWLYGCTGRNLDILARERMWNEGIDYKCGTGHGVGYILNVHEGPQGIRWKPLPDEAVLEEGMDVTDEPGVYRAGKFGIRTENVLIVQKDVHTEDGQFMKFENITMVPIDDRGMDRSIMSEKELSQYIAYQTEVVNAINPYLTEDERAWVKEYAGI
ncbi:Xaa-Pro aminopeptidase [Lachnospiraceae bacterium]|nr:Xaa-Pro aminopeptidase [Lachnospiraceae bacterium]